jgi:hypothetical protein
MPPKKDQNKRNQVSKNPPKTKGRPTKNPGANPNPKAPNPAPNPTPSSSTNPPTKDTTRKTREKKETQKQDTLNTNLILTLKTKKEAVSAKKYLVSAIKTIQQLIFHHEDGKNVSLGHLYSILNTIKIQYNSIHSVPTIKSLLIISRNWTRRPSQRKPWTSSTNS